MDSAGDCLTVILLLDAHLQHRMAAWANCLPGSLRLLVAPSINPVCGTPDVLSGIRFPSIVSRGAIRQRPFIMFWFFCLASGSPKHFLCNRPPHTTIIKRFQLENPNVGYVQTFVYRENGICRSCRNGCRPIYACTKFLGHTMRGSMVLLSL